MSKEILNKKIFGPELSKGARSSLIALFILVIIGLIIVIKEGVIDYFELLPISPIIFLISLFIYKGNKIIGMILAIPCAIGSFIYILLGSFLCVAFSLYPRGINIVILFLIIDLIVLGTSMYLLVKKKRRGVSLFVIVSFVVFTSIFLFPLLYYLNRF
jgi:hypothetical protein